MLVPIAVILIELIWIIVKRSGKDFSWFSFGIFSFIAGSYTLIFVLSDINEQEHNLDCHHTDLGNGTQCQDILDGLTKCDMLRVTVLCFQIPIIVIRWLTPFSDKLTSDKHSQLIFMLLATSADIMDFIEYSFEEELAELFPGGVSTLILVSALGTFHHCFVLTREKRLKRKDKTTFWRDFFFGTETWSLFLLVVVLDIPFLVCRCVIIHGTSFTHHNTLAFFFLKNIFTIVCMPYRVNTLYKEFIEKWENLEVVDFDVPHHDDNYGHEQRRKSKALEFIEVKPIKHTPMSPRQYDLKFKL
jgi:hypothetical protein